MRTSRTKEELLLCARSHGFRGWHDLPKGATRKPGLIKWLADRSVTLEQVPTINSAANLMKQGAQQSGSMLSHSDVETMIEKRSSEKNSGLEASAKKQSAKW